MHTPRTSYLIASSPRSGSQLLGALLKSTGLAGFPDEHFNPWHMGDAANCFPDKLIYDAEHIRRLIEKHTSPNGVFGSKAHFLQVINFVGVDKLESLYPTPLKYISLYRRDYTRQGISLARAAQTNAYNSDMQSAKAPVYNYYQILQCIREVRVDAKGWQTYFQQRSIEPLRIIYEDLVTDQIGTLRNVLDFLEIASPPDLHIRIPAITLKKQADSFSDLWVEKFNRADQE
jgi:LPS sulfotransferase NodH